MKPIPAFDYLAHLAALHDEIHAAIDRVLTSGRLVLGPEVEAFEAEFATYVGGGACVGLASGTDAVMIGLRALGVGAGDEVVTVPNTAVPTVSAIRALGATPVFCDVDADTALMDLDRLDAVLGDRTRAIVPVHLFGNAVDVAALRDRLGDRDVAVLEDCAQAHGARLRGAHVGTLGDVGAFSFYPTKNLGAFGDGGLCVAQSEEVAARIRRLREYGFDEERVARSEGWNSRLDELQAAILRVKLTHLDGFVERRRALAAIYDEGVRASALRPLATTPGAEHAYHLYVVRAGERDRLRAELDGRGIGTGIHYPVPIHRMPAYEFLGQAAGSLPVSERLAGEILSLPMYPELPESDAHRVIEALCELAPS